MGTAWWSLGLLLGACAEVDCESLAEGTLQLGRGASTYVPLESGDPMFWERGPQGGSHLWLALRATGIWPGRFDLLRDDQAPVVSAELWAGDLPVTGFPAQAVHFFDVGDGVEVSGLQMFGASSYGAKSKETAELWASVTDVCGTTVEASLPVVLQ